MLSHNEKNPDEDTLTAARLRLKEIKRELEERAAESIASGSDYFDHGKKLFEEQKEVESFIRAAEQKKRSETLEKSSGKSFESTLTIDREALAEAKKSFENAEKQFARARGIGAGNTQLKQLWMERKAAKDHYTLLQESYRRKVLQLITGKTGSKEEKTEQEVIARQLNATEIKGMSVEEWITALEKVRDNAIKENDEIKKTMETGAGHPFLIFMQYQLDFLEILVELTTYKKEEAEKPYPLQLSTFLAHIKEN